MNEIKIGDIVKVEDENYENGLYEVVKRCDISVNTESFDYDYFVTKDNGKTMLMVKKEDINRYAFNVGGDDFKELKKELNECKYRYGILSRSADKVDLQSIK